ncbi:hypothetical protein Sj15T_20310 [Sphingobium sp. TA15]|nr:hypothetical protein Sj15T_20310 [Sphingobium sp. TA15]
MVATAATGGIPAASKAGIAISPPPPAIASMHPAINAAAIRKAMVSGEGIISGGLVLLNEKGYVWQEPGPAV